MAETLEEKRIESQKLNVKLKLFKEQLTTVKAAIKRLDAMKQASMDASSRSHESGRDEPVSEEEEDVEGEVEEAEVPTMTTSLA